MKGNELDHETVEGFADSFSLYIKTPHGFVLLVHIRQKDVRNQMLDCGALTFLHSGPDRESWQVPAVWLELNSGFWLEVPLISCHVHVSTL